MELELAGKTAIVTGGGSNIGRGIALALSREGTTVVIAEFDEIQGQKVAAEINGKNGKALFVKTDVSNNDQVVDMVKRASEAFGKVDILVNSAGGYVDALFMEEERSKWQHAVNVNFWGVINCTRAVLDQMVANKSGVIISIGSDAGRTGEYREAVYAGCKGGVIAFSKSVAKEVGKYGIRVNVICPGLTVPDSDAEFGKDSVWANKQLKDMFTTPEARERVAKAYPLRKLGRSEDIANSVLFLSSEKAGHITGQTLSVSGGYTMV